MPGDLRGPLCCWGGGPGCSSSLLTPSLQQPVSSVCLRALVCLWSPRRPRPGDPAGTPTYTLGASPPAAQAPGSWSSGGTGPRAHRDLLASPTLSLSLASNRPVSLHGPTPLAGACQPRLDRLSSLLTACPAACSPYADILPSGLPPRESRDGLQLGLCPPLLHLRLQQCQAACGSSMNIQNTGGRILLP